MPRKAKKADAPGKRAGRKKADGPLVQARVDEVLQLRLDGARRWDILQYVAEKEAEKGPPNHWTRGGGEPPMCQRQVGNYIAEADRIIAESREKGRKAMLARHIAQRRNLFAKAVLAGDNSTALAVLRDEAKLLDLYPAERKSHEHSGKGGGPIQCQHAATITADDIEAARRLVGVAGGDVFADGGQQPLGAR